MAGAGAGVSLRLNNTSVENDLHRMRYDIVRMVPRQARTPSWRPFESRLAEYTALWAVKYACNDPHDFEANAETRDTAWGAIFQAKPMNAAAESQY